MSEDAGNGTQKPTGWCSGCSREKVREEFSASNHSRSGLQGYCRECSKAYQVAYRGRPRRDAERASPAVWVGRPRRKAGWDAVRVCKREGCGVEFKPKRANNFHCTPKCQQKERNCSYQAAHKEELRRQRKAKYDVKRELARQEWAAPRVCKRPGCGVEFVPERRTQEYCKSRCSKRDGHRRWRVAHPEITKAKKLRDQKNHPEKHGARQSRRYAFFHFLTFLARVEQGQTLETTMTNETRTDAAHLADAVPLAVGSMSTEALEHEFAQGMRLIRDAIVRQAAVLMELERRGRSPAADRNWLLLLHKVGHGRLLADGVVRFAARPKDMYCFSTMPVEEQERIVGMTDTEAGVYFDTLRQQKRARSGKAPPAGRQVGDKTAAVEFIREAVAGGTPQDAADLLYELVRDADDVMGIVSRLLERAKHSRSGFGVGA